MVDGIISKPFYWGLDPLFHVNVKIFASMLPKMIPGEGTGYSDPPVYFFKFNSLSEPRPIRLVALAGLVVYIRDYKKVH